MKKISKGRKFLIVFVGILLIGLGSAVWITGYYNADIVGMVISSESAMVFSETFEMVNVDTTLNGATDTQTLTITNNDGAVYLMAFWETNFTETAEQEADGCDPTGDVAISVTAGGNLLNNGAQFNSPGSSTVTLDFTHEAVMQSCPATWTTEISLTPSTA